METQSRKYEVRIIEEKDFDWCVNIAAIRMLTDEVKRPELINIDSLYLIVNKMFMDKSGIIGLCDGEYVGALGGLLHPNLLNPNIATLSELVWYVLPEYRETKIGLMLINAYDAMANNSPAHEGSFSLLNSSNINPKSLIKRGFKMEEQGYRKVYKEF